MIGMHKGWGIALKRHNILSLFTTLDDSIMDLSSWLHKEKEPLRLLNRSVIYQIHGFMVLAIRCESRLRRTVITN